jgi:cytochrome P450 family 142 subfamily A polypeptide 1
MTMLRSGFDPETIDLLDGEWYTRDPHAAWRWMRDYAPVFHDRRNDVYAVTRYDDLTRVERDPATFSSHEGIRPHTGHSPIMIHLDPPAHVKRRKLINRGFTPRAVRALEDQLHRLVDTLIDDVIERGECDFVKDLAAWLPLIVIADLLGFDPSDRPALLAWSDDLMRATTATDDIARYEGHQAHLHYDAYIRRLIAERRATNERHDDLLDTLLHTRVEGADGSSEGLDDYTIVEESMLILIGGDETTRHVMTGGLVELLRHPEQRELLASSPERIPVAVEEMLRWVSPIKNMNRTVTAETELGGVTLPAGAQVLLFYPSANRDASVFDAPDLFDVTRDPNPHVAFGAPSHHFCLGASLARLEMRVFFEHLLARMPDLRLDDRGPNGGASMPLRASNFIVGIESMPVCFTPG